MPIILPPFTNRNTITLGRTIQWAQTFVRFQSLTVGTNSEPAITSANIIQQTILGPPFAWNWNRASTTFLTTANTQDYPQAVANFGFIEKADFQSAATVTNTQLTGNVATYTAANSFIVGEYVSVTGVSSNGSVYNVTNQLIASASATQFTVAISHANIASTPDLGTAVIVRNVDGTSGKVEISNTMTILGSGAETGTPSAIAPQIDDSNGNITFRLLPVPDQVYQVNVIYQKAVTNMIAATTDFWGPIPDRLSYIFQTGFLALMLAYGQDARWVQFNQKFVSGLLGAAEGLSESQKNTFQAAWLNTLMEQQFRGQQATQGVGGRGQ